MLQSQSHPEAVGFKMVELGSRLVGGGMTLMKGKPLAPPDLPLMMLMSVIAEIELAQSTAAASIEAAAQPCAIGDEASGADVVSDNEAQVRKAKPLSEVDVAMPEGFVAVPIKASWFKENDPFHHFTPEGVAQWQVYYEMGLKDRQIGKAMGITEGASYQRRRALLKKADPKKD